jgi:tetratricopeptide (TPR) repeat protein
MRHTLHCPEPSAGRLLGVAMSTFILLGMLALGAAATSAWAADTPSNMSSNEADPLAAARQAIDQRDWSMALSLLTQARQSGQDSADLHNLLGYALRKHNPAQVEQAIQHYRWALERNPQHLGALEYLGEAYLMQGNLQAAQRQLATLAAVCGRSGCEEYQELLAAIQQYQKAGAR